MKKSLLILIALLLCSIMILSSCEMLEQFVGEKEVNGEYSEEAKEFFDNLYYDAVKHGYQGTLEEMIQRVEEKVKRYSSGAYVYSSYKIERGFIIVILDDGAEINCGLLNESAGGAMPEEQILKVDFVSAGGTACESMYFKNGEKMENMPTPTRDGYTFIGWFPVPGMDSEGWTFPLNSKQVTSETVFQSYNWGDHFSTTLYAKWKKDVDNHEARPAEFLCSFVGVYYPVDSFTYMPMIMACGQYDTCFYFDEEISVISLELVGDTKSGTVENIRVESAYELPEAESVVRVNLNMQESAFYTVILRVADSDGNETVVQRRIQTCGNSYTELPFSFPEYVGVAIKPTYDTARPTEFKKLTELNNKGKYILYIAFRGDEYDTFRVLNGEQPLDYYIEDGLYVAYIECDGSAPGFTYGVQTSKTVLGANIKHLYSIWQLGDTEITDDYYESEIISVTTDDARETYSEGVLTVFEGENIGITVEFNSHVYSARVSEATKSGYSYSYEDGKLFITLDNFKYRDEIIFTILVQNVYKDYEHLSLTVRCVYDVDSPPEYELEYFHATMMGYTTTVEGTTATLIWKYDDEWLSSTTVRFRFTGLDAKHTGKLYMNFNEYSVGAVAKEDVYSGVPANTYNCTIPILSEGTHNVKIVMDNGFTAEFTIIVYLKDPSIPDIENMGAASPNFSFDPRGYEPLKDIKIHKGEKDTLEIYYHKDFEVGGIGLPVIVWDFEPQFNIPVEGTDLYKMVLSLKGAFESNIFVTIGYHKCIDGYKGEVKYTTFYIEVLPPIRTDAFLGIFLHDDYAKDFYYLDPNGTIISVGETYYDFVFTEKVSNISVEYLGKTYTFTESVVGDFYLYKTQLVIPNSVAEQGNPIMTLTYTVVSTGETKIITFSTYIK